ncbi:FecR domain-containing protein [Arsenicibacter rosenii]|nr:FecR domain-containing protein [Arsenicibacter rosenii]
MMNNEQLPIDDSLIGKYLAGEATADEAERVRRWLDEGPEQAAELDRFGRIWDEAANVPAGRVVDTDAAWAKVNRRMKALPADTPPETGREPVIRPLHTHAPQQPVRDRQPIWRVAAAVVLLLGAGWIGYQWLTPGPVHMQLAQTQAAKQTVTLPDGSTVLLNRNSRLDFPDAFTDSTRQVTLTGEAFFDIKPDADHPFVISARGTTVRVLGTSFTVRAYSDTVRVAVATGRVQFAARKQRIVLRPDEEAVYLEREDTIRKAAFLSPNVMAFRTNRLTFDKTTLTEVVRSISELYGQPVTLSSDAIKNCRYTGSFENEKLEEVLEIVATSLKLKVERSGQGYVLAGNSCQ